MRVTWLELPGVARVDSPRHADRRGFLVETIRVDRLAAAGIDATFVQHNHAHSVRGVLRGLHWQRRHVQGKLVSVVHGAILDVVADVRPSSPTFGQHVAVPLVPGTALWVPPGYAHGFLVTSAEADVWYANTDVYDGPSGRGVRWDDPTLAIPWPVVDPILSDADAGLPTLDALTADDLPEGP